MSDSTNGRRIVAPYAAWRTFRAFLAELATKGTPSRIDQTVMRGKSGSVQSAIRKTLQFLDLTDAEGTPTQKLTSLLGAVDTEGWAATLERVILDAYEPIVEGLDMKTGTAQQLAECFRMHGHVSGNTLTMAVRFFLAALDEAGVERSSYFAPPPRPPSRKRGATNGAEKADDQATKAGEPGMSTADAAESTPPPGQSRSPWKSQPFMLPTRSDPIVLRAPPDLNLAEWDIIDAFVRGMIQLGAGAVPPPSGETGDGG